MRSSRSRCIGTGIATFEQLERRQMLAGAISPVVRDVTLGGEATYVQPGKFIYKAGGFLSKPSSAKPLDIALNYVKNNAKALGLSQADVSSSVVTDSYTDKDSGITHVYLRQTYNGLEVYNTDMTITVMKNGQVLSVGGSFVPGVGTLAPAPIAPALSPVQGLKKAVANLGLTLSQEPVQLTASRGTGRIQSFGAPQVSTDNIPAQLHYVATSSGVQLTWNYVLNVPGGMHWYETNVNANTGALLWTNDFIDTFANPNVSGTMAANPNATYPIVTPKPGNPLNTQPAGYSASYNVYARPNQSPSTGPRTLEASPWDPIASPNGWQDTDGDAGGESNLTAGNNVAAQDDRDANNTGGIQASGGALAGDGTGSLSFDFPIDFTLEPTTPNNQLAAITNLYYWNNVLHDVHYKYGFTELARNFQQNNYGNGGLGNDRVQADAQDGSSTNNANFGTPADGGSGRMQMFLFTAPTPDRDGDLDAQVMIHEYGHGVSNRLSGNASGLSATQSGGLGEGWGDWWGLMLLQTDGSVAAQNVAYPTGTYVLNQPLNGPGIRRQPYSYNMAINTQTLGTYNSSSEVHNAGELWAGVLWDMNWNLIRKYGFNPNVAQGFAPGDSASGNGNLLAMRLVMDALKIQPISPSFLQARDAILAADNAINGGADAKEIWRAFARRGWGMNASTASANSTTVTENFDVPASLFDPFVASVTPTGSFTDPNFSTIKFNFDEPMNNASFDPALDIVSFTGVGGVDLRPQVTGFAWTNGNRTLAVSFSTQVQLGSYSMTIGPDILAADNNNAMDQNFDGALGQADDQFTMAATLAERFPGPDGGGYEASQPVSQNLDLVIGQPGVTTLVNATDNTAALLTLPAGNTFRYYGANFTSMSVSPNGIISFGGTASTSTANSDLTTTPTLATIAVAWDNWTTALNAAGGTDSAVLWQLMGNDLIIEWSDVPAVVSTGVPSASGATFQAILHLNTGVGNGDIVMNYVDLNTSNTTFDNAASASVGIKAAGTAGANRLLISQNRNDSAFVQPGKAIRYSATAATGTLFADNNGNGVIDGGEAPVTDAFVYNDANNNGVFDAASEMSATTDASGNYKITSLVDGPSVIVRSLVSPTHVETQPTPTTFAVGQGLTATGANIGVFNTTITGTAGTDTYIVRQNAAQDRVEIVIGGTPTYSILKSVVPTLTFNSGSGADVLTVDYVNGDALSAFTSPMRFVGSGNVTLSATGTGTFNVSPTQGTDTPNLELFVSSGATMNLSNGVHLTGIILNSANLNVAAGAANPLVTNGLGVIGGSKLDLNDNDMIVFYSGLTPLSNITGLIQTARNGGAWNGNGVSSTSAAARAAHDTTLGAIEASAFKSIYGEAALFDGEALPGNAVLVKYTYYGDTDFNGAVDFDDYSHADAGFNNQFSGWLNGDFDGNGVVDFDDYSLIDLAFNTQLGAL